MSAILKVQGECQRVQKKSRNDILAGYALQNFNPKNLHDKGHEVDVIVIASTKNGRDQFCLVLHLKA
jgi:hypothetical protein